MKYLVPVEWDAFQALMLSALMSDYRQLGDDLRKVYDTNEGIMFSKDAQEDMHQISKLRVSLRDVIEYYGGDVK